MLNLMILMSSSTFSFCLQAIPISSTMAFPSLLSATANSSSIYFSTMFLLRNLVKAFGIFPFIIFVIHLKASEVLLNLWKSSRVSLSKHGCVQFLEGVGVLHVLLQVFYLLQLLGLVASEEGEPGWCLEQDQHSAFNEL
jgi:hypothetical protein